MGNHHKKKIAAMLHNHAVDIKDNIFPIGICGACKQNLIMYLKSEDANVFNYYCSGACEDHRNIRDPKDGDQFWVPPQAIIDILKMHYGEDKIETLFEV